MGFGLLLVLLLNFGISWFNAWSVGRSWADSKAIGGWPRFVVWCAAIMSAAGFTWCYTTVLALGAGSMGYLTSNYVRATLEIGYIVIIFPILGSGLGIWIDSLTTAWRRRDVSSLGIAAWNTYAGVHNTYGAISVLPGIFGDLTKTLGRDNDDDTSSRAIMIVFMLTIIALCGGVFTTAAIIRSTGREYSRQVLNDLGTRAR